MIENNTIVESYVAMHQVQPSGFSVPIIRHNIFWAPFPEVRSYISFGNIVCNTFLHAEEAPDGNISTDPAFCGTTESRNLFVQAGSPCAPGNTPGCGLIGALPVGCSVAVQGVTWTRVKQLYRAAPEE